MWVNEIHDPTKVYGWRQELHHCFYEKKSSSKLLMMKDSAMPESIKNNANAQEIIRRFRNCGRELGGAVRYEILKKMVQKLWLSGYGAKQIRNIVEWPVRILWHGEERREWARKSE